MAMHTYLHGDALQERGRSGGQASQENAPPSKALHAKVGRRGLIYLSWHMQAGYLAHAQRPPDLQL